MDVNEITEKDLVRIAVSTPTGNHRVVWCNTNDTKVHVSGYMEGSTDDLEKDTENIPGIVIIHHFNLGDSEFFEKGNGSTSSTLTLSHKIIEDVIDYEATHNPVWRRLLYKLKGTVED